jgi:hypothetical protein
MKLFSGFILFTAVLAQEEYDYYTGYDYYAVDDGVEERRRTPEEKLKQKLQNQANRNKNKQQQAANAQKAAGDYAPPTTEPPVYTTAPPTTAPPYTDYTTPYGSPTTVETTSHHHTHSWDSITTPLPPYVASCWACDAKDYAECYANGKHMWCEPGSDGACMFELRTRTNSDDEVEIEQICMGCKPHDGCLRQKGQNFHPYSPRSSQCKPGGHDHGDGSVCTQCCFHDDCFMHDGYHALDGTNELPIDWMHADWDKELD